MCDKKMLKCWYIVVLKENHFCTGLKKWFYFCLIFFPINMCLEFALWQKSILVVMVLSCSVYSCHWQNTEFQLVCKQIWYLSPLLLASSVFIVYFKYVLCIWIGLCHMLQMLRKLWCMMYLCFSVKLTDGDNLWYRRNSEPFGLTIYIGSELDNFFLLFISFL